MGRKKKELTIEVIEEILKNDPVEPVTVPDVKTHLTEQEIKRMDIFNIEERVRKQEIEILNLKKDLALKVIDGLQKDLKLLDGDREKALRDHQSKREAHIKFLEEIKKEAQLDKEARFGFNPETGEIVK